MIFLLRPFKSTFDELKASWALSKEIQEKPNKTKVYSIVYLNLLFLIIYAILYVAIIYYGVLSILFHVMALFGLVSSLLTITIGRFIQKKVYPKMKANFLKNI